MLDHLEDNIRRVIADIRPQMLEKVIENWTSRLDYIRVSRGSPMPEIIFEIVGISGSERCHLHEDQAQDAIDRPVVEKITTSGATHEETGLQRNGTRSSFSDESRLNLSNDDNRVRVWRPRGERLNPAFVLQRHISPTTGVMVSDVIAYNTRSPLVLTRSTMTSCNHMCCHSCNGSQEPFLSKTMLGLAQARVSKDFLRTVTTLPWPARSLYLPPIDYISNHLGRRVGYRTSLNELEAKLQQIWNEMSQDIIQNLYALLSDRIALCIHARGGSTGVINAFFIEERIYFIQAQDKTFQHLTFGKPSHFIVNKENGILSLHFV
ncbi:transposable element Tcb2 transposase [Trichonephila clavipes]|nr:transposable element Tcb2 transposase [Trichonephila clavipes]